MSTRRTITVRLRERQLEMVLMGLDALAPCGTLSPREQRARVTAIRVVRRAWLELRDRKSSA